jgi:hypothetical protein
MREVRRHDKEDFFGWERHVFLPGVPEIKTVVKRLNTRREESRI